MKIDKSSFDNRVCFNEDTHTYFEEGKNDKYTSVTTIIHKFTQEFDSNFWSSYKALEKILSNKEFSKYKKMYLENKKIKLDQIKDLDLGQFAKAKEDILAEWKVTNEESCIRGTAIHKKLENSIIGSKTPDLKFLGLGGKIGSNYTYKGDVKELIPGNIYPEILLYTVCKEGILKIAGQVDLLIVDHDGGVYIADFKTNKEIKQKSFFDSKTRKSVKMKYPLNTLDDVNFSHYKLQLSLYYWLVKKMYPNLYLKGLYIIHFDHNDKQTTYEVDYLEKEVEIMLKFFKKTLQYEDFQSKFEKINF